jgi:hypothetical protein
LLTLLKKKNLIRIISACYADDPKYELFVQKYQEVKLPHKQPPNHSATDTGAVFFTRSGLY